MTVTQPHLQPRLPFRSRSEDDSSSDDSADSALAEISSARIANSALAPSYVGPEAPVPLGSIIRIEKIAAALPIIGENLARTTIFKDIDETALHLVREGIDFRDFTYWAEKKYRSGLLSQKELSRLGLWALNSFPSVPVEPDSLDLCRRLQASAKAYLYLTARSTDISDLTEKHLREFPPGLCIPHSAPKGVYFTNATSKAAAIQHLNKISEAIRTSEIFVLIDDNIRYITPVVSECNRLGKTIICLHYTKPYIPKVPTDSAVNALLIQDRLRPFTPLHRGDTGL